MKKYLASASLLALCAQPALAQDGFDLGQITLFTNLTPTYVNNSGAVVEIIDQDTLQAAGTTRVIDTLDSLPGISVSGNGGMGKSASLSIRGLPGRYVPVYVDGIDMTDPSGTQTQFNWGGLLNDSIGQIEVRKGSQSALFGSEAIGGVVNISTQRAPKAGQSYRYSAEIGSYATRNANLFIANKSERGEIALSLAHFNTDGFSAASESAGNTEADGYRSNQAVLSGSTQASEMLRLGFTLLVQDEAQNLDAFGGAGGDADKPYFTDRTAGRVFAEINGDAIDHTLGVSASQISKNDPTSSFTNTFEGNRTEIDYLGNTNVGDVVLSFGAKYSEEDFLTQNLSTPSSEQGAFDIASVFVESQHRLGAATDLSVSVRRDEHSTFGGFSSNRAALVHRLTDQTRVRGSLGNGFRAPSLYELFGPYGNLALQPEKSRSAEIGIEHDYADGAGVQVTAFYTEIDDLIEWSGGAYNQVSGTSVSQGIELSGGMALSDALTMTASYTYTDATDRNGSQLKRVPENNIEIGFNAQFSDSLNGALSLSHVAGRANDGFPSTAMPDYTVVNANLGYAMSDNTRAYLRIENLLDEEYETSAGYGTSGRAAYFGIRAEF
jgi:vitamin B12 transporter